MEPDELEEITLPTRTYLVQNGRILSMTDGMEAIRQAVEKILLTPRFSVLWLSPNYGHDLEELLGKSMDYAKADVERIINEAFSDDDRIETVEINSITQRNKNTLIVSMNIESIFGDTAVEKEVMVNDT